MRHDRRKGKRKNPDDAHRGSLQKPKKGGWNSASWGDFPMWTMAYSAAMIASTESLASPSSMSVLSLKNSGFWTPA